MLKSLNPDRFAKPASEFAPGPAPQLSWIEVEKLVVDHEYQRAIGRRGTANIAQIAENFDWSKFAPVIVAPVEGGLFAIVDGQHRTTAAMLRGQTSVPCQIVQADRAKQAAAYAAVNGNITKTTPTQLFYAQIAAGEEKAVAIFDICAAANVVIVRTNMSMTKMNAGQTSAINALKLCYSVYGKHILQVALRCITQTGGGNAGYIRSTIVESLCYVLRAHPEWTADEAALIKHMDKFSFPNEWDAIVAGRDRIFPNTAKSDMIERIEKHLSRRLPPPEKRRAA